MNKQENIAINEQLDQLSERIDSCLQQINELDSIILTTKYDYMKERTSIL